MYKQYNKYNRHAIYFLHYDIMLLASNKIWLFYQMYIDPFYVK